MREKVVRAHDERRLNGLPAGYPGFGHRKACGCGQKQPRCLSPDHDRWAVHPDEAERLREMIRRILAGSNLAALCKELNAEEVPTRLGGQWRITTLRKMLMSPRLAGILVHNGNELGKTDAIEPIIDEPTFRRLCARITPNKHEGPHREMQLLTGVLVCSECGAGLNTSSVKGGKSVGYIRTYGCRSDGRSNIKAEAVEAVYVEKLFERLSDRRFTKALARTDDESTKLIDELRDQDAELDALKAHADRLPVDVYVAKYDAINARITELNRLLTRTATVDIAAPWIGKSEQLRSAWDDMPIDEQRALILSVVGKAKVLPAARPGERATPEAVKARLLPLST